MHWKARGVPRAWSIIGSASKKTVSGKHKAFSSATMAGEVARHVG